MGKWNFAKLEKEMPRLKRELPIICGDLAVNFFRDSFNKQGFDSSNVQKWKEVQRRISGTKAHKYATKSARTRAILVKSGALRRATLRKYTSFAKTVIINEMPYAKVHNEGSKNMPKRQFIGQSKSLDKKTIQEIDRYVKKILKK